ncbi:MAG: cytochrome c/FTR1 family iron permease, partial [Nitrospinota bacterium]|nr:cytochrome c/FTR1 family iron permease [Nitrospinota bacterium]
EGTTSDIEQDELANRFSSLIQKVKSKTDPGVIHSEVNAINSGILNKFNIKLSQTPSELVSLDNGRTLYMNNCKVCHGIQGKGDGPIASQLDPKPAVLADPQLTGDEFSKPYDNFQIINVGIANTAMVGWADQFSEKELWDVTYFIRSFSNENVKLPLLVSQVSSTGQKENQKDVTKKTIDEVFLLLDQSMDAYREGRNREAAESAVDAYLVYEKVETVLITKRKELGLKLESSFGRLQAEIKRKAPIELVDKVRQGILSDLKEAQQVLTQEIGFTGLFIQSFSIIVREGFEAILIIAALITFLVKSRNQDKLKAIYLGVLIGIIGSFITAYILQEILDISMASQEMMEGVIMLVAVVVLFYVSYWLVSKIEATKWQSYITGKMQKAVTTGSAFTLSMVAFLSVYREGFETVLFYKALYLYAGDTTDGILPGFIAGCAVLGVVYFLINQLGMRIPVKWFFVVTSVFLYYMAFMFMGKGLHQLQMGGALGITGADFVPEIPWLGMYPTWETFIGQMIMVVAYAGALVYTFGIKQERAAQELKTEATQIQQNITVVHDLVEHISHHAKRCEIFLKDTRDQDLKELSQHLKEIDSKVHELFDQVIYFENHLTDEYDRLSQPIGTKEKDLH